MNEDKLNPPYNDLIGDILKEYTKKGGMDNLAGPENHYRKSIFLVIRFSIFNGLQKMPVINHIG